MLGFSVCPDTKLCNFSNAIREGGGKSLILRFVCLALLMAGTNSGKDLACGNCPAGVGLERIIGGHNILPQPALYGGIPFFQSAQTSPDNLACRGVSSGIH